MGNWLIFWDIYRKSLFLGCGEAMFFVFSWFWSRLRLSFVSILIDFGCSWNEAGVEQKYRRRARLLLVILVLCAFFAATMTLTFRQPSIRTDLKTGIDVTAKLSVSVTHGPTTSSNDSDLPFICPCSVPENSWCSYTTFYLLYPQQVWHFFYTLMLESTNSNLNSLLIKSFLMSHMQKMWCTLVS